MSNSTTNNGGLPSSLIGIIATKPDFAPSVIFIVAYACLLPLAIWRFVSPKTRSLLLIRPALLIVFRIATYIVRALEANGNYSVGVISTELVLLTVGAVFLIEPLISLTTKVLEAYVPYDGPMVRDRRGRMRRQDEVGWLARLLRVALIAVIGISIYAASNTSDAFKDPDAAKTVSNLRRVTAIILVVVLGVVIVGIAYFQFLHPLPMRTVYFIFTIALLLLVGSAYRLASASHDAGANNRVAFWLAQALTEWLVTLAFFVVNINSYAPAKPPAQTPSAQELAQYPPYQLQGR
ncbi:hypothetical protein AURDEDRAFT_159719 [Auricularia subglabra TFB-10046 SS5]|nr:hypothetical protein AURDEDRAFT_159719 [Auricularia subglabra TFB-10046 SS5]